MPFGRLRRRMDQMQGKANFTMDMAIDLIKDLQDGFGLDIEIEVHEDAAKKVMKIMMGQAGKIPIKIEAKLDPTVDTE